MRVNKLGLAVASAVAFAATPASAVEIIIFNFGGYAAGTDARKSLEVAAAYWESVLTDNLRVNLKVYTSAGVSTGYTAVSASTMIEEPIESVYGALIADSKSSLDAQAVANLMPLTTSADPAYDGLGSLTVTSNDLNRSRTLYVDETTRIDSDGSRNNTMMQLNYANAEALGYISRVDDTASYSEIAISTKVKFDYDPTDGIDEGSYDFTGIAIREIAVFLGLYSNVSSYDFYTSPNGISKKGRENALEDTSVARAIDLFRYSDSDTIDWSTSSEDKYFSIDGGDSQLFGSSSYGTGALNGDGTLEHYWKDNASGQSTGIMDQKVDTGTGLAVSALDLAAIDAIGWDLNIDVLANSNYRMSTADIYRAMTAVPEPSTWLQMLLGFGLIGSAARYRRRNTTVSFA